MQQAWRLESFHLLSWFSSLVAGSEAKSSNLAKASGRASAFLELLLSASSHPAQHFTRRRQTTPVCFIGKPKPSTDSIFAGQHLYSVPTNRGWTWNCIDNPAAMPIPCCQTLQKPATSHRVAREIMIPDRLCTTVAASDPEALQPPPDVICHNPKQKTCMAATRQSTPRHFIAKLCQPAVECTVPDIHEVGIFVI